MSEFENVLQQCLQDLEQGASNVEGCLQRHPKYAAQLEPILLTSTYLARGRDARLSSAFKARVRSRLVQELSAHPRRAAHKSFGWMRLAVSLAVMLLTLLVAGTAYAQRALPGESFYAWKLASENAWRAVSTDPVATDIAIAQRRVDELLAVRQDPALSTDVLNAYIEVTDRLKLETDPETEALILAVLDTQIEELNRSGITLPQPQDEVIPPLEEPVATSTSNPTPTTLPVLETPPIEPTNLPQIGPTVEVLPQIIPTVKDPPKLLPTVEIPPPIR